MLEKLFSFPNSCLKGGGGLFNIFSMLGDLRNFWQNIHPWLEASLKFAPAVFRLLFIYQQPTELSASETIFLSAEPRFNLDRKCPNSTQLNSVSPKFIEFKIN